MAERKIVWTKTAAIQMQSILEYWYNRNKSSNYSEKIVKITEKHLTFISKHPESFRKTEFKKTRVSVMGYFSIFYQFDEKRIIVTAFWDNRQDSKKLIKLLER
ncbi:MAG: type II toxin-antitoxin system RelE/ParE family toxin [Chitinophagales bacterium]|nr:type II toxin-antitoxin system RelE/ParE family toxin [Chitinophagales bacterium]